MKKNKYLAYGALCCLILGAFFCVGILAASAFNGPSQAPPSGNGAVGVDASQNLSVGTSTPSSSVKFFIVAPNALNTRYGFTVNSVNNTPILTVRNDGRVGIVTSTPDMAELTVQGDLYVTGNVTASNVGGGAPSTDPVSAAYVTSDVFGRLQGGGPYAFPGKLAVNTSTQVGIPLPLSVYASSGMSAYFAGNVGIATTVPAYALDVAGTARVEQFRMPTGAAQNLVLTSDASGVGTWQNVASLPGVNQDPRWVSSGTTLYASTSITAVGIGTANPAYTLDVNGAMRLAPSAQPAGSNGAMYYDSGLNQFRCYEGGAWKGCTAGGITGGQANYVPKWITATSQGTSTLYQSSTYLGIGTVSPAYALDVSGTVNMAGFRMPPGAVNGRVLTSDASGVGTWQAPSQDPRWVTVGPGPYAMVESSSYTYGLGIGIIAIPNAKVEIMNATGDNILQLDRNGQATSTLFKVGTDGAFVIQNMTNDSLIIKNNQIGIATTAPAYTLDVAGTARVQDLFIATATWQTGYVWKATGTSGYGTWQPDTTGISGGQAGYVPLWLSATAQGTSTIYQSPTSSAGSVGIGTTGVSSARLVVQSTSTGATTAALNVVNSAGNSILFARSDQRVGIGTTTLNDRLEIAAVAGAPGIRINQTGSNTTTRITFANEDTPQWSIDSNIFRDGTYIFGVRDLVNGVHRMVFDHAGKVGIGQSVLSPVEQLHVGGTVRADLGVNVPQNQAFLWNARFSGATNYYINDGTAYELWHDDDGYHDVPGAFYLQGAPAGTAGNTADLNGHILMMFLPTGQVSAYSSKFGVGTGTSTVTSAGITVANGDVYISSSTGRGIILKSPDGSCYRFTVANGGALSNPGASIACP